MRRGHGDSVGVRGIGGDFDAITNGEKSVEALDEVRIPIKQLRNAVNDARSVDAREGRERGWRKVEGQIN